MVVVGMSPAAMTALSNAFSHSHVVHGRTIHAHAFTDLQKVLYPILVSETGLFEPFVYKIYDLLYQDRLGTNIGKALKNGLPFFSQAFGVAGVFFGVLCNISLCRKGGVPKEPPSLESLEQGGGGGGGGGSAYGEITIAGSGTTKRRARGSLAKVRTVN
jgi:hypothetical protein